MKLTKTLWASILLLVLAATAFGDPGEIYIFYDSTETGYHPVGAPCDVATRVGFADGVPICIFWDSTGNGPDATDRQPIVGTEVNYNCFAFNGTFWGIGAGFFITDPYFAVSELPDNPIYYLQVNSGGRCWRSDPFTMVPGASDLPMTEAMWHCVDNPCAGGPPPAAPFAVQASDDQYCLAVQVTWEHNGQNVGGFNVYADGELVGSAGQAARTMSIQMLSDETHSFTVKAFNANGESDASNADNGSTYLLRFASGPSGDITGSQLAGTTHTIHFDRPTPQCFSGAELWLLVNGERGPLVARDSLVDQITFTFPNTADTNCRLLLIDSSYTYVGVEFTDTTESIFHLGTLNADPYFPTADRFALGQNYPNPFNPETEIVFSVPTTAVVRIQIYNVMGQLVRTLTDAPYSMGVHHLRWDGRSDAGVSVGAGIYMYKMDAGDFSQVKKMLLMK